MKKKRAGRSPERYDRSGGYARQRSHVLLHLGLAFMQAMGVYHVACELLESLPEVIWEHGTALP